MSFRGVSLDPIHRNIQLRLNELRNAMAYDGERMKLTGKILGNNPMAELNKRTVWYKLRSNAVYIKDDEYIAP